MAFLKKINAKAKTDSNTGFGVNPGSYGGRFLTKNGNANIKRTGIGFLTALVGFIPWLTSQDGNSCSLYYCFILL